MARFVRTPDEGDQYGVERLVDRVSKKETTRPSHESHKVESQLVFPHQADERERRLLVKGLTKVIPPRLLLKLDRMFRELPLHWHNGEKESGVVVYDYLVNSVFRRRRC